MLGPIVCHTMRPLVFKSGLWSIEVEKSWNHLFEMVSVLMKRGYPEQSQRSLAKTRSFPNLTNVIILKDTWVAITQQMHDLGLTAVIKLFKINYNLRHVHRAHAMQRNKLKNFKSSRFYSSPKVRYRPAKMHEDTEHLTLLFNLLISILDHAINSFPSENTASEAGDAFTSPAIKKNLAMLKEPMEWLGPVFCNTMRPLLLVQGKWSYQVMEIKRGLK